jgi:hypothetical protein
MQIAEAQWDQPERPGCGHGFSADARPAPGPGAATQASSWHERFLARPASMSWPAPAASTDAWSDAAVSHPRRRLPWPNACRSHPSTPHDRARARACHLPSSRSASGPTDGPVCLACPRYRTSPPDHCSPRWLAHGPCVRCHGRPRLLDSARYLSPGSSVSTSAFCPHRAGVSPGFVQQADYEHALRDARNPLCVCASRRS